MYVKQGVWADLIPIRVISGNPSASGQQLLPGWKTRITGAVDISPALDFLVITSTPVGQGERDGPSSKESNIERS